MHHTTWITTLLVANRGEIARRIFRTCRAEGIRSVAVFSDADADLPFVAEADLAVRIGPGPAADSYLNVEALLLAAQRTGADAVHPGYGFLAENAAFARAVIAAKLTWIGPPPEAIEVMADKSRARRLAVEHDVPVVPGYDAPGASDDDLRKAAAELGVPLLVKAAAGGGGRGMRRVDDLAHLDEALASARREAKAGFGDDALLLERYVERPRHIEVQVLGDGHGDAVHLYERECTIQRRHQKVIEEAPSPAVDFELRKLLGEAAVRITKAVDYVGAGTVEFILAPDRSFYFLEMNTRLQVEHPVTELVTGRDLVADQLLLATGAALPVRQDEVTLDWHAIEARVYAEDPQRDYLPGTGPVHRLDIPNAEGLRVDAGYEAGTAVGPHYDAMLAKVIAVGIDREAATRRLRRAVDLAWVPGVVTNLPLLREILRHPAWTAGDLHTGFLTEHGLPTAPPLNLGEGGLYATALAWWLRRQVDPGPPGVPAGWRVSGPELSHDTWRCGDQELQVGWRATGHDTLEIETGLTLPVRVLGLEGDRLRLEVMGIQRTVRVVVVRDGRALDLSQATLDDGDLVYVHFDEGEAFVALAPRFPPPAAAAPEPGTCTAPTPGTVTAVDVAPGDVVEAGQRLLVLEAMKMEHTVSSPEAGTVTEVRVAVGETVDEGDLLVRLEPDEA